MVDAIVRTLTRLYVTRKNLLEWMTAAQAKADAKPRSGGLLPPDGAAACASRSWPRARRARREAGGGLDRRAVRRLVDARACRGPLGQPAAVRIGVRASSPTTDVDGAAPHRSPHLAVLRDVRRAGGQRPAARQLPGRPDAGRRPSDLADEHRHVPAVDRDRPRLRVDRHARDGRAPGGRRWRPSATPRALPRPPLQLVRHPRPAPARARVRLVGRQRQPRRHLLDAVQRLSADDRPALPVAEPRCRGSATPSRSPARAAAAVGDDGGARH